MKYIIVGQQCCGQDEIRQALLESNQISVGKLFSNIEEADSRIYNSAFFEKYTLNDINEVFENNAYIFLHRLTCSLITDSYKYYEGLSKYEFDNKQVFFLNPYQVADIYPSAINEPVTFIWLDCDSTFSKSGYSIGGYGHSYFDIQQLDTAAMDSCINIMYSQPNSCVLYFNNEEPSHIVAVIKSLILHPDLLELYKNCYK